MNVGALGFHVGHPFSLATHTPIVHRGRVYKLTVPVLETKADLGINYGVPLNILAARSNIKSQLPDFGENRPNVSWPGTDRNRLYSLLETRDELSPDDIVKEIRDCKRYEADARVLLHFGRVYSYDRIPHNQIMGLGSVYLMNGVRHYPTLINEDGCWAIVPLPFPEKLAEAGIKFLAWR